MDVLPIYQEEDQLSERLLAREELVREFRTLIWLCVDVVHAEVNREFPHLALDRMEMYFEGYETLRQLLYRYKVSKILLTFKLDRRITHDFVQTLLANVLNRARVVDRSVDHTESMIPGHSSKTEKDVQGWPDKYMKGERLEHLWRSYVDGEGRRMIGFTSDIEEYDENDDVIP